MTAKIPKWATDPFDYFLECVGDLEKLAHLSSHGVTGLPHSARRVQELSEELRKLGGTPDPPQFDPALLEFAEKEIAEGYPRLFGQATVALWGLLECLVHDFTCSLLAYYPPAWQATDLLKVEVSVCEYQAMSPEERIEYVVDWLERKKKADGVARFENVLNVFGLSGAIEDDIKKALFELQHVRNVLAHRAGRVDGRLISACPWLAAKSKERVRINKERFMLYLDACYAYASALLGRVKRRFPIQASANSE